MTRIQKQKNFYSVLITVGLLLIGFLLGYFTGFRDGAKFNKETLIPAVYPQVQTNLPTGNLSSRTMEIIRELNCICGCKMKLLPCTCDEPKGSKEIKQFVRFLVEMDLQKPEVIKKVVEKYGDKVLMKNT